MIIANIYMYMLHMLAPLVVWKREDKTACQSFYCHAHGGQYVHICQPSAIGSCIGKRQITLWTKPEDTNLTRDCAMYS